MSLFEEYITISPLFKGVDIPESDFDEFHLTQEIFHTDRLVFDLGDDPSFVYFLVSGRLLAVHWTHDGREVLFSRIENGEHFGELAAIDNGPRSLSVYAQKDSRVMKISRDDFMKLLDTYPIIARRVMVGMVKQIRRLTDRAYQTTTMNVTDRVKMCLARLAMEGSALHENGEIDDAPTHSEIANLIGANREAVSRAISSLRKSGTIEAGRGHIRLLDPQILLEDITF